jgi:hypothetical protein
VIVIALPPAAGSQVRDAIRSGSNHGRDDGGDNGCGQRTSETARRSATGHDRHQDTQHRSTKVGWVLKSVEGAFVLSGRTSGYVCHLGAPSSAGRSPCTASHQSRPRPVAPPGDGSGQNPRSHRASSHTQAEGDACPDSVSELSDAGWVDTGLTLSGGRHCPGRGPPGQPPTLGPNLVTGRSSALLRFRSNTVSLVSGGRVMVAGCLGLVGSSRRLISASRITSRSVF